MVNDFLKNKKKTFQKKNHNKQNNITSCQPFASAKLLCRLLQQRLVVAVAQAANAKRRSTAEEAKSTRLRALLPQHRRQIGLDVNKVLRHGALFARNPDKHWHFGARRNRRETQRHA